LPVQATYAEEFRRIKFSSHDGLQKTMINDRGYSSRPKELQMNDVGEAKKRSTVRQGCMKWLSRIILVAIVLPLGLLAIGFIYQTIASKSDWVRYPPPGELIDIGGYRLHLHCTGERRADQPIVVIEAGSGSSSPDWVLVQPEIARLVRVCTYDRAGLGWSDPGPQPRSAQQYASELQALLENAGEEPPYLFVAHSYGGHVVRIYTDQHPDDVVGMVLVDARLPSGEIPYAPMTSGQLRLWEFLARCGFFRLAGKQAMQVMAPALVEKIPNYPYPHCSQVKRFSRLSNHVESVSIR
jgi:hypothetical protein